MSINKKCIKFAVSYFTVPSDKLCKRVYCRLIACVVVGYSMLAGVVE